MRLEGGHSRIQRIRSHLKEIAGSMMRARSLHRSSIMRTHAAAAHHDGHYDGRVAGNGDGL